MVKLVSGDKQTIGQPAKSPEPACHYLHPITTGRGDLTNPPSLNQVNHELS